MSKPSFLPLLTAFLIATSLVISTVEAGGSHHDLAWMTTKPACQGSIAECMENDEFEMDSESHRRILQTTTRYISYGALQANNVPCSRRGASYYNCRPGAEANPYTRSCTTATQCRS